MTTYFGTDGIRAPITHEYLSPEKICRLGRILGTLAQNRGYSSIVIGRDTRASGLFLEAALNAGILSSGVTCHNLGIAPSAAVAYATNDLGAAFGIVISASHNPASDNGIKIFNAQGYKIDAVLENAITELIVTTQEFPISNRLGLSYQNHEVLDQYCAMLTKSVPWGLLKNRRVVIDCAHGAATALIERIVAHVAADVIIIGNQPDGYNINHNVGSEHPAFLIEHVLRERADLGIAFDGDADRVIFVNEKGEIVDGDALLALLAIFLKKEQKLHKNTVVSTVMSSIALDQALTPHGITVERTAVGDKYVVQHLLKEGLNLGGENSGHLILFPHTTTGDGLFFALQCMNIVNTLDAPVSSLLSFYQPTPKILKNLPVPHKVPLKELSATSALLEHYAQTLEGTGRVMVRYSGTENKLRVFVEALSHEHCHAIAGAICEQFSLELQHYLALKDSF